MSNFLAVSHIAMYIQCIYNALGWGTSTSPQIPISTTKLLQYTLHKCICSEIHMKEALSSLTNGLLQFNSSLWHSDNVCVFSIRY